MAFAVNDRVKETTTTTGTGTLTLDGAATGFETFSSAIGNGNTTYYSIASQSNAEFEVGIGTVGAGTLSRDTIISSSNSDAAVNFSAGTKDVFVTLPASKTILLNDSDTVDVNGTLDVALTQGNVITKDLDGEFASSDAGIIFDGNGSYKSGIFTEVDGELLSYAINTEQIDSSYDSSRSGSIFRLDTRTSGGVGSKNCFVVKTRAAGSTDILNGLIIDLNTNDTLLCPSAGNVGIGTSSPNSKTEIVDTNGGGEAELLQIRNNSTDASTTSVLRFINSSDAASYGNGGFIKLIRNAISDNDLTFGTVNTERMRIDGSGNVGIGTSNPDGKLHIDGASDTVTGLVFEAGVSGDNKFIDFQNTAGSKRIGFEYDNTNIRFNIVDRDGNKMFTIDENLGGDISFYEDTGTTAKFFWDASAERLGIGTSSPSAKLHILGTSNNGGIFIEDSLTSGSSPALTITGKRSDGNGSQCFAGKVLLSKNQTNAAIDGAGDALGTIQFGGNHTDGSISNILYAASIAGISEGAFNSSSDMPSGLAFYTGSTGRDGDTANVTTGTERMRIDENGNVGIGTSNPTEKLVIIGDQLIAPNTSNTVGTPFIRIRNTGTGDGSPNSIKIGVDGTQFNGIAYVDTLKAGVASTTPLTFRISGSEAMRIDSSGNVGIGTSSPSQALDVVGSIEVSDGIYVGGTAAANKLDDYEEGTFTPLFVVSGVGSVTLSGGVVSGTYTKIGRIVYINIEFDLSADTNSYAVGTSIRNLPFTWEDDAAATITLRNSTTNLYALFEDTVGDRVNIYDSGGLTSFDDYKTYGVVNISGFIKTA